MFELKMLSIAKINMQLYAQQQIKYWLYLHNSLLSLTHLIFQYPFA